MKKGSFNYLEDSTINAIKFLIEEGSEEFKDNLLEMLDKAGLIDEFIDTKIIVDELVDAELEKYSFDPEDTRYFRNLVREEAYARLTAPGGE